MDCVLFHCSLALILLHLCKAEIYTHTWAAHIEGGEEVAKQLAAKHGFDYLGKIFDDHYHLKHHHVAKRSVVANEYHHGNLKSEPQVQWLEQQVVKRRVKRDASFNDPKWPKMWYLNRGGGLDMNVAGAWQKGHRGKGVVVSILDDGIEKDHPDLKKNYDPGASYDVNSHDPDPQPRYDYTNENRHGTRCAGEVAAQADNHICNVGVAYEASIGGVRMLDGDVTDAVEATSLSLNPNHIDIYSASWGPDDDGRTVDGPARLAQKAFRDGIYNGRNGKGNIFVWASGNGGRDQDSCNCDGYTNSIFTLSISSATESGHIPWYSEACSSTLSTTYSSGSGKEHQVITTDLRKGCTETHTGTSASAPLAAGIAALALSANKALTWRDMQHIVVMTSRPSNLKATDWVTNGFGKKVSHSFGFGLMDASAMVDLALNWTNVPNQHICTIKSRDSPRAISVNGKVSVSLQSDGCQGTPNEVNYLEHVQAVINLTTSRRGQVQIFLTSPHGTKSTLLTKRPRDSSTEGFKNWAFMTTHNWGENSRGTWTLEIENDGATYVNYDVEATLISWSTVLYGTTTDPLKSQSQQHPRPHSQDCLDGNLHAQKLTCLDKCPISFYTANQTTNPSTNVPSPTATTTTPTAIISKTTTNTLETSSHGVGQAGISTTTIGGSKVNTATSTTESKNQSRTTTARPTVECLRCSEGCAECVNKEHCSICLTGYNLTINATCVSVGFGIIKYLKEHISVTYVLVTVFLCVSAVIIFLIVFCILQLMEPNSCLSGKGKYRKIILNGDAESGSKLSNLVNGITYNNGTKRLDTQGLLESNSDSDTDMYDYSSFNSKRINHS